MQSSESGEEQAAPSASEGGPSRVRTLVTLSLLAAVIVLAVVVPRLLSPAISADEEAPEGHFQAMCVLCHSFE